MFGQAVKGGPVRTVRREHASSALGKACTKQCSQPNAIADTPQRRAINCGMAAVRRVIGANLVDLVKIVVNLEKSHGPLGLSTASQAAIKARVNLNHWYDLAFFSELLGILDRIVIKGSEQRALEIGAAGGSSMRGIQKAYVVPGDPKSSVVAMRHAWRAHFDFGRLTFEVPDDHTVRFKIEQYPDMTMTHALLTAGWGVAAARAAGAQDASATVLARPWRGEGDFTYTINF
jgi:hypothetical protein